MSRGLGDVYKRQSEPRPLPPAVTSAPPPADRSLAEERALLDAARAARARGDDEAAISAARGHESRFPAGQLAEEREAIWIQALVRAQRVDEARSRAASLRARAPRSVFLPVVDAALAGARKGSPR